MKHTQLLIAAVLSSVIALTNVAKLTQVKWSDTCCTVLSFETLWSPFRISPNFYTMYRNDCQLLYWNQNCDLSIRFATPRWRMNKDRRQIASESRQKLRILTAYRTANPFSNARAKSKGRSWRCLWTSPKFKLVAIATSLRRPPNEYRDNHPHQYAYQTC